MVWKQFFLIKDATTDKIDKKDILFWKYSSLNVTLWYNM